MLSVSLLNTYTGGLPCGFVSKGVQLPEQPSFTTNNVIPILQYPAGNSPGTTLQIPDALYSERQNDQLILQPDGNLVIYCTTCNPAKAIWSSQTNGKNVRALYFQPDGDLVLRNANGKMVWHSNIHSSCAGSEQAYFTLQDDGNLVMLYNLTIGNGAAASSGASPVSSPASPASGNSNDVKVVTEYLGGTGSTNDQDKMSHPGKLQ
jgi:hypothetical protein